MDDSAAVPAEVLRLLEERIGRCLEERPLALDSRAHRERIAALLAHLGDSTYYGLLSLEPTAGADEVHDAYERVARLVHPHHAGHLGLEGRQATLELLFERVTRAYLTLSHPDRRKLYDRDAAPHAPEPAAFRGEEQRRLARGLYDKAARLVELEEFHFAIELLRRATQVDPRPEYYTLLGDLQSKNPHWLRHAVDSYREALHLGAETAHVKAALGEAESRLQSLQAAPPIAAAAPQAQRRARAV